MKRYNKKTMTVDSKEYDDLLKVEIEKWCVPNEDNAGGFEAIAERQLVFKIYRKGTVETELDFIARQGEGIDVLELGSSDGWFANEIIKLHNVKTLTCIDVSLSREMVSRYDGRVISVPGDLNKIERIDSLQGRRFDCIVTRGTMHHLVDPSRVLTYSISAMLKQGGIIINEDTWILRSMQLKTNALIKAIFGDGINTLAAAIGALRTGRLRMFAGHLLKMAKLGIISARCVFSRAYAGDYLHNKQFSPFESISSADDYKDIYGSDDVQMLYFKRCGALANLYYSNLVGIPRALGISLEQLRRFDEFLIRTGLFCGEMHICVLKKGG